ncbi:hypothetical protein FNF31_00398 [Cafeteria roenbergensis]|uniref:Cyclic nucleotide-binding domain-containing protein n=1 Tax=Cafeteria roenbergensis TaxID=33653 RepID=A0A5A8DTA1_CAFRO|nr:hypothetical protein FNF31_00398 [Cafeteria roenbergensis]
MRGVSWLKGGLAPFFPQWLLDRPDFRPMMELRADSAKAAVLEVIMAAADAGLDAGAQQAGSTAQLLPSGAQGPDGKSSAASAGADSSAAAALAAHSARSLAALAAACEVPPQHRKPIHTLTIAKHLARLPICVGMTGEEVRSVSKEVYVARAAAGETVFEQGDEAHSFYVLLQGSADVIVDPIGRVHTLCKGEWFGERALVKGERRTASIVAVSPLELLVLPRNDFAKALKRNETSRHLRNVDFLQGLPFFAGWTRPRLSRLLAIFVELRFPAGALLARQGDTCARVFIVADGTIGLWHTATVRGENRWPVAAPREPGDETPPQPLPPPRKRSLPRRRRSSADTAKRRDSSDTLPIAQPWAGGSACGVIESESLVFKSDDEESCASAPRAARSPERAPFLPAGPARQPSPSSGHRRGRPGPPDLERASRRRRRVAHESRAVVHAHTDRVGIVRPGAIYGLHLAIWDSPHPLTVRTMTAVRVLAVPAAMFRAAVGSSQGPRASVFVPRGSGGLLPPTGGAARPASAAGPALLKDTAVHGIELVKGTEELFFEGKEAGAGDRSAAELAWKSSADRVRAALRARKRRASVTGLELARQRQASLAMLRSMTVEEASYSLRRALHGIEQAQLRKREKAHKAAAAAEEEDAAMPPRPVRRPSAPAAALSPTAGVPAPPPSRRRNRRGSIGTRNRPVPPPALLSPASAAAASKA